MKVAIVGGGPAGLYFALRMKRRDRGHRVAVFEQNAPDATYGFGVVFSERALGFLERDDADFHAALTARMERWPEQTIVHRDTAVRIDGNGFAAIGRLELLELLRELCLAAGVEIAYRTAIDAPGDLDADLVVGADGANSTVRRRHAAGFGPTVEALSNRFAWYGTERPFDTLTLTFRPARHGAFVAHHYRYGAAMSTFIVECDDATWRAGLAALSDEDRRRHCEAVFAPDLGGHRLLSNKSLWRRFPVVTNRRWWHGNTVLIGDALRTVHFSIGSGTRLALEDAIFLDRALAGVDEVAIGLERFEAARRPIVAKILAGAAGSFGWYERFADHMALDPYAFAHAYMTRSGRMSPERLRRTAPRFTAAYEAARRRRTPEASAGS